MYRLKPAALLLSYAVVGGGVHFASSHEVIQSGMRPVLLGAVSLCAIAMSWAALVRYIVDAREAKQEILRLSSSDGLTGLMNRHKAIGALDAAIDTSVRTGKMGVLMIVGLDRFKNINSSYYIVPLKHLRKCDHVRSCQPSDSFWRLAWQDGRGERRWC